MRLPSIPSASALCKAEIIEVADEKTPDNASENRRDKYQKQRSRAPSQIYRDDAYLITLEIKGKQLTSEELAQKIDTLGVQGTNHIIFVIGGSLGLGEEVSEAFELCAQFFENDISASVDAGYSAGTDLPSYRINCGEPYHK